MRYITSLVWLFALLPYWAFGMEISPWYERDLEIYPYAEATFQHYDKVAGLSYSSNDLFLEAGGYASYNGYFLKGCFIFSDTHAHSFAIDQIKVTGIKRLMDDILGDFATVNIGMTLSKVSKNSVRDPSTIVSGRNQAEIFLAVGKEETCRDTWRNRVYSEFGLGVADHGSPWVRGEIAIEGHSIDASRRRLFLKGVAGMGNGTLTSIDQFQTYGSLNYIAVDIGAGYFTFFGPLIVTAEAKVRIYSRTCQSRYGAFSLALTYPFGL